jgi:capsular polysaccharide biosynthesis protein
MGRSWKEGIFEERAVEVFRIKGAYVVGEGLVLDRELRAIENVSDKYSDEEIARAVTNIRAARKASTLPHFDKLTILAKRRAVHNYGHYLIECFPMAVVGTGIALGEDPHYLTHLVPTPAEDVTLRSFRLLGVDLNQVLIQVADIPWYFDDLLVVRGLTSDGTYISPFCIMATNLLVEKAVAAAMPGKGPEKIFVRRVPGWGRGREMHNEEQVFQRLSGRGFVAVEPGTMSLDQQIILFSQAKHVIGVAGAAMTNIAFCNPGTRVTLLYPANFPDAFFWFIAQHKQLDYLEIRCDQTTYEPPESWVAGFTIREKDIAYLEQIRSVEA